MFISNDEVKKIAFLARLGLTEQEVNKFQTQLESIFSYIDKLQEVDVNNVEETSQVTGLENVSNPDVVEKGRCTGEELLATSPLPIVANQIRVKKVI